MQISKGRQVISAEELALWQNDTWKTLSADPELLAALKDPSRNFNQDETSVQLGNNRQKVLACRGTKLLYHVSSSTRDHITISFTVSAKGRVVPPRCVFKGVRNVALQHLKDLSSDGMTGKWGMSCSVNGYVTQELFISILKDLDNFLTKQNIARPIILWMDGATPHMSIAMAEFCKLKRIQPWLFKPNATHITQPLDLTFFQSLKARLQRKVLEWHQSPLHIGSSLSKYSVVPLVRESAEEIIKETPRLIPNGFKRSGLCPWNPSAPDKNKMLPSTIFSQNKDSETENTQDLVITDDPVSIPGPSGINHTNQSSLMQDPGTVSSQPSVGIDDFVSSPGPSGLSGGSDNTILSVQGSHIKEPETVFSQPSAGIDYSLSLPGPSGLNTNLGAKNVKSAPTSTCTQTSEKEMEEDPIPKFTARSLHQYEAVFFTETQLKHCEKLLEEKNFTHPNPMYQAWLTLKLASLPTEKEAIQKVLDRHSPSNLPKCQKTSQRNELRGAARFNPTSQEWVEILEEREAKNNLEPSQKKKTSTNDNSKPIDQAENIGKERLTCEVCGKTYASKESLRVHKYQHKPKN